MKIISNIFWRLVENTSTQFVSFIVSIVLARLLLPSDYGTITLVMVIINLLTVFVNSSMATTLIQKKEVNDDDYSTAFYFNLFVSFVLYIIVFVLSPYIARFYGIDELNLILRIMCLVLIAAAIKNVQFAFASKNMQFKKFFYSSFVGTIVSALVGIYMAYNGYGVWSLVAQQLFDSYIDALLLWIIVGWRPKSKFSFKKLKELFEFGSKLLTSTLIEKIYVNITPLIVGKMYKSSDLAYYNKGKHLPDIIITNISASIESVLLPAVSNIQDDIDYVKELAKKSIELSTYIIFPIVFGIIAISKNFVIFFYTEKWLMCVPYICIFSLMYMFYPIKAINLNNIKALGKGKAILSLQIIEKTLGILLIIITSKISPIAIAYSCLISSFISTFIYIISNKKYIKYGLFEQINDTIPQLVITLIMYMTVILINFLKINILFKIMLQICIGIVLYIILSKVFKIEAYIYIKKLIKSVYNKES